MKPRVHTYICNEYSYHYLLCTLDETDNLWYRILSYKCAQVHFLHGEERLRQQREQ